MSKIKEPKRIKLPPGPMPYLTNVSKDDTDDGFRKTLSPQRKKKLETLELQHMEEDMIYGDMTRLLEDNTW